MPERFLRWLGYGLCHQLPERSFFGGGVQLPVCARDTGIYVGFVVSLAVLAALHRHRPRALPSLWFWVLFGLSVLYMGVDGVTSYAGLRESTNLLRLTSGMCVGYCCAGLILPMLNDVLWQRSSSSRVLESSADYAVWLGSGVVSCAATWWVAPSTGVVYPIFVALCIILTLTAINLVMVGMLPAFDRKAERPWQLLAPGSLALLLAFAEVYVAGVGRGLLESAVRTLA